MAAKPGYFNPDQFSNDLNVECHYRTTGRELVDQVPGPIVAYVAGVGTGGSLIGAGKAIRERYPKARIVAVEPDESAVMSGGEAAPHRIFGIGDGFIPPIAQNAEGGVHDLIDAVERVSSEEALDTASMLRARYGFCIGISSGANYAASLRYRGQGAVATLFADGYIKYRSHGLREAIEPECPHAAFCTR
jgi:cysteine synthase A